MEVVNFIDWDVTSRYLIISSDIIYAVLMKCQFKPLIYDILKERKKAEAEKKEKRTEAG